MKIKNHEVGICHFQGRRPTMEDEHLATSFELNIHGTRFTVPLFGIFDGHGGRKAAQYLKASLSEKLRQKLQELNPTQLSNEGIWNAIKQTFVSLNHEFREDSSGSTATIAFILNGKLWTGNGGDSRIILENGSTIQLTEDAKPSDPRYQKGIHNRGGTIEQVEGVARVNGCLAIARSVGDHRLKGTDDAWAISARPKITAIPIPSSGSYLVLACDGVWDVASSKQVGKAVRQLKETQNPLQISQILVSAAYKAGSTDNLSAMVVRIP